MNDAALGNVKIVTTLCKICGEKLTVEVPASLLENATRFPVEYAHVHGNPPHGMTLYFDKQFQLRGTEFIKNVSLQGTETGARIIPRKTGTIPPMAVSLGMVSKKEFQLLQFCDGKASVAEISKKAKLPPADVEETCRQLEGRKFLKLEEK